jgi:hypothetical protein
VQPIPVHRQKDKVVALPDLPEEPGDQPEALSSSYGTTPAIFEVRGKGCRERERERDITSVQPLEADEMT